jgi:quercetin dioxygenase-like cupin family protein
MKRMKRMKMVPALVFPLVGAVLFLDSATAQDTNLARPNLLQKQIVEGMPKGDKQEVSVLTASFKPGDKTLFHTHRFPVTVYVTAGAFTLELEGQPEVTIKAGEAYVEPPNVRMTGYNRSTTEELKVVIFYVGDPNTPFLDPIH